MRFESWIIDAYLDGLLPVPGPAVQVLLTAYMQAYYWIEPFIGRGLTTIPPESEEIAARSRELMETHYNMPLAMFASFLGRSMKYSTALWEAGVRSLDEAQQAMLADVCAKADLRDGQRILDIGCGFGSFAAHALRRYPRVRVVGLTLSDVQYRYIAGKQGEPGHPLHGDRFRVIKEDFAQSRFDHPFDRVVSIGVFEHVSNLRLALEKIAGFLKPDGTALLHFIAYRRIIEAIANMDAPPGFIGRYIFPGGRLWPYNELFRYQQHLQIERAWFLNGNHYLRTLEAWRDNFWRNMGRIRVHPDLEERFVRVWDLYLRFCIAVFRGLHGSNVGNGQYRLRHAGA